MDAEVVAPQMLPQVHPHAHASTSAFVSTHAIFTMGCCICFHAVLPATMRLYWTLCLHAITELIDISSNGQVKLIIDVFIDGV